MLRHRLYLVTVLLAVTVWMVRPAAAQLPTNASLQGAYYVRYLGANVDINNPQDNPVSFSGTITFDGKTDANGNGGFTVSGQGTFHDTADHTLAFLTSGTYGVLSGATFYMTNPFDPTTSNNTILYGGIGIGVVTASSTESNYTDLFVAIPVSTAAANATLNGKYYLSSLEFQNGDFGLTRDTFFSATATGDGKFGDFAISGTAFNLQSAAQPPQTSPGVTYTVAANGSGTLTIPVPTGAPPVTSQLLVGTKVLYVSSDGSFFIAGGASAYDMILGVKALSGNVSTALSGLYFTALLENYTATDNPHLFGSAGSSNEINSIATEISHLRLNDEFYGPYDATFSDPFPLKSDGTSPSPGYSQYVVGAGGNIVIGSGDGTNYQVAIYVKAPVLSGTGVFLNPQGIVNAANSVPFTAQVAPGEVVSLYGTGLSSQTLTTPGLPFPPVLGNVSVNLSWVDSTGKTQTAQAPIYFVSSGLISCVIPYTAPSDGTPLNFRVSNNGTDSNLATVYTGATSPGIFTVPPGGLGDGAILHADYTLVSNASPAKVGDTVQIFLTGLGPVTPAVTAGTAGPSSPPLSTVPDSTGLTVFIDGLPATVAYAGLAPTLGGLYQLNVTIPSGVTLGSEVSIEIQTNDADNIQATIAISK